jgi:hypothetical protein
MSWHQKEKQMIQDLNRSVFVQDPIKKATDPMSPIDAYNTNYVIELKNREDYSSETFDGSLIEKFKYDYLVNNCVYKTPAYICRFTDISYYGWNLKKVLEPEWYDKILPETSHFDRNEWINKKVGNLYLRDAIKLLVKHKSTVCSQ